MTTVFPVYSNESTRILKLPVFSSTCVLQAVGPRLEMVALNAPTNQQARDAAAAIGMKVLHEEMFASASDGFYAQLHGIVATSSDRRKRDTMLAGLARDAYENMLEEPGQFASSEEQDAFTYLQQYRSDEDSRWDAWSAALLKANDLLDVYLAGTRQ